jgi:hypothetical protein
MPATVEAKTPAATTSKIIPPIMNGRTQPRKIERAIDGCRSVVRESFSPRPVPIAVPAPPHAERRNLDLAAIGAADSVSSAPAAAQSMYWSSSSVMARLLGLRH